MNWDNVNAEPSGGFNLVMALFDGQWGAGKTFTALAMAMHGAELLDATVGVIDSENRMGPYEVDYPRCKDTEKYKRIVTTSPLGAIEFIKALGAVEGHKILITDSQSLFWPAAQDLRLKDVQRVKPTRENLAINDWGPIKKWVNTMIDLPNQLGIHSIATGRIDDEYEDQDGERVKVGVRVSGEKQMCYRYYTHLSMRPEQIRDKVGHRVQTGKVICQITKDSFDHANNHTGEHWVNPTGEDLAWIWSRLQGGATAVPSTEAAAEAGAQQLADEKPIGKETAKAYARKWVDGWNLSNDTVKLKLNGKKLEELTTEEVLKLDNKLSQEVP